MTRKSRGLRLSHDSMSKLKRLARATSRGPYELVEAMIDQYYAGYRADPRLGPALEALEKADEAGTE